MVFRLCFRKTVRIAIHSLMRWRRAVLERAVAVQEVHQVAFMWLQPVEAIVLSGPMFNRSMCVASRSCCWNLGSSVMPEQTSVGQWNSASDPAGNPRPIRRETYTRPWRWPARGSYSGSPWAAGTNALLLHQPRAAPILVGDLGDSGCWQAFVDLRGDCFRLSRHGEWSERRFGILHRQRRHRPNRFATASAIPYHAARPRHRSN